VCRPDGSSVHKSWTKVNPCERRLAFLEALLYYKQMKVIFQNNKK
jgi:hypothetical protein